MVSLAYIRDDTGHNFVDDSILLCFSIHMWLKTSVILGNCKNRTDAVCENSGVTR